MTSASESKPATSVRTLRWPHEPYKGLDFFTADDAVLFSQRDQDVENCAAQLDDFSTKVLFLHGFSGMGKSSFLRAGLLPRLENPPEDSGKFFFLRDGSGKPAVVRATGDPIARMYETLAETMRGDKRVPGRARAEVQRILAAPPHADRLKAAETLLSAVETLAANLGPIFALVVDQAEEVLTLPQPDEEASNRRTAFFWFLEELCQRSDERRRGPRGLTPHAIVSLRTEYVGQVNSFFTIPPTLRISSAALPPAGVAAYFLEAIREPKRIADIIRLPTLKQNVGRQPPPFEFYHFEFAPNLPERIAADVLKLAGDSSTLPVLQVVCKTLYERLSDQRHVIELSDYETIGFAEGALDDHIDQAIQQALATVAPTHASRAEIDRWRSVLCNLVGQPQVGSVTSLVLSELKLVEAARIEHVDAQPLEMLHAMSGQGSPVLRSLDRPGGHGQLYSLGHDCLSDALSRWQSKHSARLQAEREHKKRIRRIRRVYAISGLIATTVFMAVMLETYAYRLNENKNSILALDLAATHRNNLRDRLLMLVAASESSRAWPMRFWLGDKAGQADQHLKDTLLRAPVFGGWFPAALDRIGDRFAYFDYLPNGATGSLKVENLPLRPTMGPASKSPKAQGLSYSIPLAGLVSGGAKGFPTPPPIVGFVELTDNDNTGGSQKQAVVISPAMMRSGSEVQSDTSKDNNPAAPDHTDWHDALRIIPDGNSPPSQISVASGLTERLKDLGREQQQFPPFVDFGIHSIRLSVVKILNFQPSSMTILPLFLREIGKDGIELFQPADEQSGSWNIDWQPVEQKALRMPVFASDCRAYAFLGFPSSNKNSHNSADTKASGSNLYPTLYTGNLGPGQSLSVPHGLDVQVPVTTQALSSVAIAPGCSSAVIRVSPDASDSGSGQPAGNLIVFDLEKNDRTIYDTPDQLKGFVIPSYALASPPLVVAKLPDENGKTRVAWLVESGLAVVDIDGLSQASGALPNGQPFLTGLDTSTGNTRMSISKSGNFLLILHQKSFSEKPEMRIFDLRVRERMDALGHGDGAAGPDGLNSAALRAEACRVAGFLSQRQQTTPANQFTPDEITAVLRVANAPQPCPTI